MANYTDRDLIERVNGQINVRNWADLNNTKNANEINERINWAALVSTEYLNGRLILGRYSSFIPFSPVPTMIQYVATLLAGVVLYDGRMVTVTAEGRDEIGPKRKQVAKTLRQILNGQLKLLNPTSGVLYDSGNSLVPSVLEYTSTCPGVCCKTWNVNCHCHTCVIQSITLPIW